MTDAEKAFREAFDRARGVPPVRPLDPAEIEALAGEGTRRGSGRRPSRWLAAAAAAIVVAGGGAALWGVFGHRDVVPAVPAGSPTASAPATAASTASGLPLLGSGWLVTSLPGAELTASDPDQTVDFTSGRAVSGRIGCTTFTAPYSLDGTALAFGTVDVVAVPCPSGPARLIQPFLEALDATAGATLDGDQLRFTDASGQVVLSLRRAALSTPTPAESTIPGPTPTSTAADIFERTRALPDAPAGVRSPGVVHSCGRLELGQGGTVGADALRCLTAQYSGVEGAELAVTVPTTEGDPIVYFFVHTIGAIRAYSTDHWDNFRGGSGGWTTKTCELSAAASWRSLQACAG
jgi:heat shock protein HslJ